MLTSKRFYQQWGATATINEILLTLAGGMATNAVWDGFKLIGREMARRMKSNDSTLGYVAFLLTPEEAERSARRRVQLRRNAGTPADLTIKSLNLDPEKGYTVVLTDEPARINYTVEVESYDGFVEIARIRQESYV